MSQSKEGAAKAVAKIKETKGENWYREIGRKGGTTSRGGGFSKDPELASRAGMIGGKISSRKGIKNGEG